MMDWRLAAAGGPPRPVRALRSAAGYRVTVDGRTRDVIVTGASGARLECTVDGRPLVARVVPDRDRWLVQIGGADPVTVSRSRQEPGGGVAAAAGAGILSAVMDGLVVSVAASAGDRVAAGATLVVLEAMKMEIRLVAPFAGRVVEVRCSTGEAVRRGAVLVRMEPEPPGAPVPAIGPGVP